MRTQEEIKKQWHKFYRVYFYLYDHGERKEIIIAAANQQEADEMALSEAKKRFPSFADTLYVKGVNLGG